MNEIAVLPADASAIERAADPANYVIEACERAKTWLAHALEHGGIDQIIELKSQAEAIRVYTMSKQLGKDAELSAAEIVRRAERGIGLAIRKGQEAGEFSGVGFHGPARQDYTRVRNGLEEVVRAPQAPDRQANGRSPAEFFGHASERVEVYAMTDDVSDEQFDSVIADARAEGNLSRKNVVRKARAKKDAAEARATAMSDEEHGIPDPSDRTSMANLQRREVVREMAGAGYTSQQIADRIGRSAELVRQIAREMFIEIQADVALGRGSRKSIDSNRIVRETVHALDGLAMGAQLVEFEGLDQAEIAHWTASLTKSLRILNRLNKQLKEMAQQ